MATEFKLPFTGSEISEKLSKIDSLAEKSEIPSISTGSSNGTISIKLNGASTNIAVKGLGSAAYTPSTAYDAAGTAQTKANAALASAKSYADGIKNDLLNGAGGAYDTLKELGDLIKVNVDAIDALESVAASKVPNSRTINGKALTSNISLTASDVGALPSTTVIPSIEDALAQAKASGEFDGKDGVSATHSWNGTTLTITSASGSSSANLKGAKGDKGDQGIQGPKGDTGATGATGQRGTGLLPVTTAPASYTTAVGGITPKYRIAISTIKSQAGVTEVLLGDTIRYSYYHYPIAYLDASYAYFTTRVSIRGATGAAGTTPVRGTDYLTEADKEEIVRQVLASMAMPVAGIVDENNNIIITGELPDGAYTLRYEFADGSSTSIGTLNISSGPAYTNQISISIDTDGSVYNGVGYKADTYISSSTGAVSSRTGIGATGFIPIKEGDVIRFKDVGFNYSSANKANNRIATYDANKNFLKFINAFNTYVLVDTCGGVRDANDNWTQFKVVPDGSGTLFAPGFAYMRICAEGIGANSIITINEPIE